MLTEFNNHINQDLTFLKNAKLLIAISGGVDSVVLTYLCKQSGLNIALAHCNFKLRDEESDADEAFVEQLGEQLDVEVFVQQFDTELYAQTQKLSIQMAARELRYNWFSELANQLQFDYVLTAHHADDNVETFLINFLRGTGLNGLTGIPKVQGKYVRPLLNFSREEILNYAKNNAIKWREDSSNSSRKYLRNKLRHEVVPILKDINPELLETFRQTISNLNDTASIVDDELKHFQERVVAYKTDHEIAYHVSEFKKTSNPKAYLFEIFKNYGFTEWNDVLHLLEAQSGKQVFSNTHRLIKHRDYVLLVKKEDVVQSDSEASIIIKSTIEFIQTSQGRLTFEEVKAVNQHTDTLVFIDKDKLQYPLEIRHWKEGDWFCPFGMKGKKKLSKFFKDEKFSLLEKERQLVLCSGEDIVWIIGKRLDNRFKVKDSTNKILRIELK